MFITNVLGLTFWEEPKLCRRTYYHGVAKQESPCEAYDNKMRPWSLIINSLCWNSRISSQTLSILYIFIILISHALYNKVIIIVKAIVPRSQAFEWFFIVAKAQLYLDLELWELLKVFVLYILRSIYSRKKL